MKTKLHLIAGLLVLCLCSAAYAAEDYYLPQIANGESSGVMMKTTFILFNPTDTASVVTLALTDDSGNPLAVTIPGHGTNNTFNVDLAAGQTVFMQTDGSGALVTGAAHVSSTESVAVSGVFAIYVDGSFVTEAGVGASELKTNFVIPVDMVGFDTGLALFNPGTTDASLDLTLLNENGGQVGQMTGYALNAGNHVSHFVTGAAGTSEFFTDVPSFTRGTLVVTSDEPVAALTVRQHISPLSFTTLPVIDETSSDTEMLIPQVADGGGYTTTFLIFSLGSPASVTVTLTDAGGNPLLVTIPSLISDDNVFGVDLLSGEAKFLQTNGVPSTVRVGGAQIHSTAPVGVAAIFTLTNNGKFVTEAGVGNSSTHDAFTVPVDYSMALNTGIAFYNPGPNTSTVDLRLLNPDGTLAAQGSLSGPLAVGGHDSKFVNELFPTYFQGKTSFQGSIAVGVANNAVAAVALRQNNQPTVFTTFPVAEGVTSGGTPQPAEALLTQSMGNLSATASLVQNVQLSAGFKLSGSLTMPTGATVNDVTATSTSGNQSYPGVIGSSGDSYLIVLPAGTYQLSACYALSGSTPGMTGTSVAYDYPSTLTVSADMTQNLSLPDVSTYTVSGTLTGADSLVGSAGGVGFMVFNSADEKNGAEGYVTVPPGNYSVDLPQGSYTVSAHFPLESVEGAQYGVAGFYNLGTVTVSAANVTQDFALPSYSTLSGTLSLTNMSIPDTALIYADDASYPGSATVGCIAPLAYSDASVDTQSGAYQTYLVDGRQYALQAMVGVSGGVVMFPMPADDIPAVSGDVTHDFTLGTLPGTVTISGQVTNPSGAGVQNVGVSAVSADLTGLSGAQYTNGVVTDSLGNYTMTVLSGTNYTLYFTPPTPAP